MRAQWFCEPDRPLDRSWILDAPWAAASLRNAHEQVIVTDGSHAYRGRTGLGGWRAGKHVLRDVFYGDSANGPEMTGLSSYYSTLDGQEARNSVNVLDGGGTESGALSSAWLICWSPRTLFMISPDGEPVGVYGECAVVVADWRFAVRVANIDPVRQPKPLTELVCRAMASVPHMRCSDDFRPMWYMNRDCYAMLKDEACGDPRVSVGSNQWFSSVAIREVEELRSDEARV